MKEMLDLTSPRWAELSQAHGSGEDIPRLLEALNTHEDARGRAELWLGVWATLCPGEQVYTASYAAAPHLLAISGARDAAELVAAVHVIAQVEALRHEPGAPGIPADLVAAYAATVESLPVVVAECAAMPWDPPTAQIMAAALLAGKRQPVLARAILTLGLSAHEQ